jgi:hypothetical protein
MMGDAPQRRSNCVQRNDPDETVTLTPIVAAATERRYARDAADDARPCHRHADASQVKIAGLEAAQAGRSSRRAGSRAKALTRLLPVLQSRPRGFLPADIVRRWDEQSQLFIHIPKTAGTSLCAALYGRGIKHRPAWEIALFHPVRFTRNGKFAVVREPVDRFLSAYDYLRAGGKNKRDSAFAEEFLRPHLDINCFVAAWRENTFRRKVSTYFHFSRQSEYISLWGRYLVNRLVRFDHLANDVQRIFGHAIRIPEKNVTPGERTPADALSAESLDFLAGHYAHDFAIWRRADESHENLFWRPLTGGSASTEPVQARV